MSASRQPALEPVPGVGFRVRIRYGKGLRDRFTIKLADVTAALKRAETMTELARMLTKAGHSEQAPLLLTKLGEADDAKAREIRNWAQKLCLGQARVASSDTRKTFRQLGEDWTSGRLASKHPDHVKVKRSVDDDVQRLGVLYRTIGDVPLAAFRLDDAEKAMAAIPARAPATRRQYAQLISKVLNLAVYPCRLLSRSPLPRGFLPAVKGQSATSYLYPDEDSRLLSCPAIPLERRVLYGFLDREGMRLGEALGLTWRDLDLERGMIRLDENKTDDPRAWALSRGVVLALRAWRGNAESCDRLFADFDASNSARTFRADLGLAGVTRPELFERTANRRPIRVHDLRATFVTLSLANGATETWVMDRTGHRSSQMVNHYRRAARQVHELGLGALASMVDAVPELAGQIVQGGPGSGPALFAPDALAVASDCESSIFSASAEGRGRTDKSLLTTDFESAASANSATSAQCAWCTWSCSMCPAPIASSPG